MKKTGLALVLAICMIAAAGLADTISFSGTVEPSTTAQVYAPVGGTIEEVPVKEGQTVTADTVIAKIKTTKVYAAEDGTITATYGEPGDDAESVAEKYGAVMYLEGAYTLQIEASTSKAYEAKENYIVHSGETVYLVSRNHTTNKGVGMITAVDGSSFTVLVTEGEFIMGDSIDIMRDEAYTLVSRVGRGNISRISPTAVTGTGSIVSYAVKAGAAVKRGDLLFETVEGSYDALVMTGTEIRAGTDGVIASLNVEQGGAVSKDSVVASIYPKDAVWVSAEVAETDLTQIQEGQKVKVELDWNQDLGVSYEGTIEMISALGTVGEESTTYPVYVSFLPDENTRYSMTALVTTLEGEAEEQTADLVKTEEKAEPAAPETQEKPDRQGKPETETTETAGDA